MIKPLKLIPLIFKRILLFIYFIPFLISIPVGIAYNVTGSMKTGYYLIFQPVNLRPGEIVFACVPLDEESIEGMKRNYLPHGGFCPGGRLPVVKFLASLPYQTVVLSKKGIKADGRFIRYKVLKKSPEGLPIKHYPYGKYNVDGYFLISTYSPLSYDSRYWGPVKNILYKAVYLGKKL
jgi:conjugative transfer signal peptidase TraF